MYAHPDRFEAFRERGDERDRIADIASHEVAILHPPHVRTEHVGEQVELIGVRLDESFAVAPGSGIMSQQRPGK